MTYLPVQLVARPRTSTTSFLAPDGVDLRTLPQLLNPNNALKIKNYIIDSDQGMEKRGGIEEYLNDGGTVGIGIDVDWGNYRIYSFGSTLKAEEKSTGTKTVIKSNFIDDVTGGEAYGNYFLVSSPQDKIGRISMTLAYDTQTANYATGLVLTGGTSGATAIILEDSDAGATGTLTLGDVTGTFAVGETITDSATGSADVTSVLALTYTVITDAPMARHIKVVDTRLVAGDLLDNREATKYSEVDDGSNPPFDDWTVGTGATQAGLLSYRNAGKVNVITTIGTSIIVVFAENGKWAYRIDTIDSAGTLSKVDTKLMYIIDAGGKAAIQTDEGIFYVNSQGLWQLVAIAQENIKYSDQEVLTSTLLGNKFFDDVTLDNASIVKDDKRNTLLVTVAQDSTSNNFVILYNTVKKAFGTITGWAGNTFLNDDGTIYMGSSTSAQIWEIFKGNDDDGSDIWYEFEQELTVGQLETKKELLGQYIQGELSPSTTPLIKFSIYDKDGVYIADKLELQWNFNTSELTLAGYGEAGWGESFGGDVSTAGAVENFAGASKKIKNFQRIRVNISGHDQAAHTINWLKLLTKEKMPIRRRNLTTI